MPSMATKTLNQQQVLVGCNESASDLVGGFESELNSLKESKRLELITLVSDACRLGYRSSGEGMQYKDVERYLKSTAHDSDLPIELLLSAVKRGYSMQKYQSQDAN